MELRIETTPDNFFILMRRMSKDPLLEFAEGLMELQKIILSQNRGAIAEKLALLEYQIFCIQEKYFKKEKFVIKDTGRYDLRLSALTYSDLVSIYLNKDRNFSFVIAITKMTHHICHCLYNVYDDFDITFDETEKLRKRNMRRLRHEFLNKERIFYGGDK